MQRVGIYSGTFDPVHKGHLAFALAALRECKLDTVVFLPDPEPRRKVRVTNLETRVADLREKIAPFPEFEVVVLGQPNFTSKEILPVLQTMYPGAELVLLLGSDVAKGLSNWPDVEMLLGAMQLAIGVRGSDNQSEIDATLHQLKRANDIRVNYIHTDYPHLSSSQFRLG